MRAFLFSLAALTLAGAAHAQSGSSAALQQPTGSATRTIIDGVQWRCAGQACVAVGEAASQPALRACKRFTAQIGPVSAFTYNGRAVTAEQLTECNARARQVSAQPAVQG